MSSSASPMPPIKVESTDVEVNQEIPNDSNGQGGEAPSAAGLHEDDEVNEVDDGLSDIDRACRSLHATTPGIRPTRLELDLASFLLANCEGARNKVVDAICVAAVNWERYKLWDKAVKTCTQSDPFLLRRNWVRGGLRAFGVERTQATLGAILQQAPLLRRLFALFDNLNTLTGSAGLDDDALQWISNTRENLCEAIGKAAQTQHDKLIHQSLTKGGLPYFRDNILPVCASICTSSFLSELAIRVHRDQVFLPGDTKRDTVFKCLQASIAQLDIAVDENNISRCKGEDDLTAVILASGTCKVDGVIPLVFAHVEEQTMGAVERYVPVVVFLLRTVSEITDISREPCESWCTSAYTNLLTSLATPKEARPLTISACIKYLQTLVSLRNGLDPLFSSLRSRLNELSFHDTRHVLNIVEPSLSHIDQSPALAETYQLLLRRLVDASLIRSGQHITSLAQMCLRQFKSPAALEHLANRLLLCQGWTAACKTVRFNIQDDRLEVAETIEGRSFLVELLVKTQALASENGLILSCGSAFCTLIMAWMQVDVRKPPALPNPPLHELWTSRCPCRVCQIVSQFLGDAENMSIQLSGIGSESSSHIMEQLSRDGLVADAGPSKLHWITYGKGMDMKINKSPSMFQPIRSRAFKAGVHQLFHTFHFNPADRARILGPLYVDIMSWLESPADIGPSKRANTSEDGGHIDKKPKIGV